MIGCFQTHVRKHPIVAHYFEFETVIHDNNYASKLYSTIVITLGHKNKGCSPLPNFFMQLYYVPQAYNVPISYESVKGIYLFAFNFRKLLRLYIKNEAVLSSYTSRMYTTEKNGNKQFPGTDQS